jgi:uncharacterized protein (DUF983 family)
MMYRLGLRINEALVAVSIAAFIYDCSLSPPPWWTIAMWLPLVVLIAFMLGVAEASEMQRDGR